MKKLATKLTPAIKAWIKEEFGSDFYDKFGDDELFCFPNYETEIGFLSGHHLNSSGYTEVSEQEFLAEFAKPKVVFQWLSNGIWKDILSQDYIRIKPTPDYSKEIEVLQEKAKENGMKVTVNFEKI